MPIASPRKFPPEKVGVPGPDGVFVTAVTPKDPKADIKPPQVPKSFDTSSEAGLADFLTQTGGPAPAAVEEAVGPFSGMNLSDLPLAEERLLGRQASGTAATNFGQFAPRDLEDLGDVRQGNFGAAVGAGFSNSLLGWMMNSDPGSASSRDRATAELINYSAQNPWKSTIGQIAGGFAGDAPLEVALALGTLGFGNAVVWGAKASGRGAVALRQMAAGVERLKRAYRLNAGKSISRQGFNRAIQRGMFETGLGVTAGAMSEALQQHMGKEGDFGDIVYRAAIDGLASAPFAQALRFGGRALRFSTRAVAGKLAKTIASDTPGVRAKELVDDVQRALEDVQEAARLRDENVDAASARSLDDAEPATLSRRDSANVKRALKDYEKTPNAKNLRKALAELLEGDTPRVRKEKADLVMDVLNRRAKAAGKTLKEYLATKRLLLRDQNTPSQIVTNANNIIGAPARATSVDSFMHEIGHLIYADLNDAHRSAFKRLMGVAPRRQLGREQYEEFANRFVDWVKTGKANNRPQRRMFQAVANWIRTVYRRLANKPQDPTLQEMFEKLLPESGVRADEPFGVPTRAAEQVEFLARKQAGLEQLFKVTKARKKRKITPEQQASRAETQKAQEQIAERGNKAAEEVELSTFIPDTTMAKLLNKVQRALGRLLYSDNLSLNSYSDRLGPGFIALKQRLQNAVQEAARLNNKMRDTLNKATEELNIRIEDTAKLYNNKQKVSLETKSGTTVNVEMDGFERLKLTMYALDGFDRNLDPDKVSRNSAQQALTASKGGFINPSTGLPVVLSKAQLKKIQNLDLLSDSDKAIMESLFRAYRSIKPDANKTGNKLIGQNLMSPENAFYNPKNTNAQTLSDDIWAVGAALIGDKKAKVLLGEGNLRARSGAASLKLVDPLQEMNGYINRMSDVLAKSETMASYKIAMDKAGERIEVIFGSNVRETLDDLIKVNSGDTSLLGAFSEGGFVSRMFSAGMISKLALNPAVAAKQLASAFTAAATGKVRSSGFVMGADAANFAKNKQLRDAMLAEMVEHNPIMARRLREEPQFIEVEDAIKGMGSLQLFHGKIPNKTLLELARKGDIKLSDAVIDLLRKGTVGIKVLDESTLASLWKAVKKDIVDESLIEVNSPAFWKETNRRWNDILMETQPTTDPSARSINQMKRGIPSRFLTMFTTQTRKNWELADKEISRYSNIPDKTADDRRELIKVMAPLAYQTAYVSAVGVAYGFAFNKALGILQNEKRRKAAEKRQEAVTQKLFTDMMRNMLGQQPIIGKLSADFVNAMFGQKPFTQALPILDELTKFNEGLSQGSLRKMSDGLMQLAVPTVIRRPVSETIGKLQ